MDNSTSMGNIEASLSPTLGFLQQGCPDSQMRICKICAISTDVIASAFGKFRIDFPISGVTDARKLRSA